jgi:hypothetical protein
VVEAGGVHAGEVVAPCGQRDRRLLTPHATAARPSASGRAFRRAGEGDHGGLAALASGGGIADRRADRADGVPTASVYDGRRPVNACAANARRAAEYEELLTPWDVRRHVERCSAGAAPVRPVSAVALDAQARMPAHDDAAGTERVPVRALLRQRGPCCDGATRHRHNRRPTLCRRRAGRLRPLYRSDCTRGTDCRRPWTASPTCASPRDRAGTSPCPEYGGFRYRVHAGPRRTGEWPTRWSICRSTRAAGSRVFARRGRCGARLVSGRAPRGGSSAPAHR